MANPSGKYLAAAAAAAALLLAGALPLTGTEPGSLIRSLASRVLAPTPGVVEQPGAQRYTYNYSLTIQGYPLLEYSVEVYLISRTGSEVCFTYHVKEAWKGSLEGAKRFMREFMGAPEYSKICTTVSEGLYQARYFFAPSSVSTTTRTALSYRGNELQGVATLDHGVLRYMSLDGIITSGDGRHSLHLEAVLDSAR